MVIPQNIKKLGPFILFFLKKQRLALCIFLITGLIWSLELSLSPYLLKVIIDTVSQQSHPQLLLAQILLPAILYVSMTLLMNCTFRIYEWTCLKLFPSIKADIILQTFMYLTNHSYSYFQEHFAGSIAKKVQDLAQSIEPVIKIIDEIFIPRTIAVIVASIMLLLVNPIFSIILFLWAASFIMVTGFLAYRYTPFATDFAESYSQLNGSLVDSITNIITSKIFANESVENLRINTSLLEVNHKDRIMQRSMLKLYCVQGIYVTTLVALMLSTLIYGRLHGWVSIGDFAFVLSLSMSITMAIWDLGQQMVRFTQEVGKCQQALSVIIPPHSIKDAITAKPIVITNGSIEFKHVDFGYQSDRLIMQNLSLKIPGGQKVGLVGFSGSGKSTLVKLILRLFDIQQGNILIDDQDIQQVTQHSLRKQIALIPQEPELFHRTILENIRYGNPNATDEEVITAAHQSHCDEFIRHLPAGYHALVGERGIKLSGGQRQRIAIARAVLKKSPILMLDEATSALDSVTEQYIQQDLRQIMQHKTTIVIAHRLSTLQEMDRILFFENGSIIEDGALDELRGKKGAFAKMWTMQSGGYLPET